MQSPKHRPKWNRGTIGKHNALKASKIERATGFKTRIHGTPKQVGQKFPVGSKLPIKDRSKLTSAYPGGSALSTKNLAKREAKKMTKAGFDGFTLILRMKNGEVKTIPVVAKSWDDFLAKIRSRLKGVGTEQISELSVAGGGKFLDSLKSGLTKVGSGARGFAEGLLKGAGNWQGNEPKSVAQAIGRRIGSSTREFTAKMPSEIEKAGMAASHHLGYISGTGKRLRESYTRGYEGKNFEPKASPVNSWGQRAAKPYLKFVSDTGEEYVPKSQVNLTNSPLEDVEDKIDKLIGKLKNPLRGRWTLEKDKEKLAKLIPLQREVERLNKERALYSDLTGTTAEIKRRRIDTRLKEIMDQVSRMGGKCKGTARKK
jgi:hypothetical protein